jgi:hypothetical protein
MQRREDRLLPEEAKVSRNVPIVVDKATMLPVVLIWEKSSCLY